MKNYDGVKFYCPNESEGPIEYTIKDDGSEFVRIDWINRGGKHSSLKESRSEVAQKFAFGGYVVVESGYDGVKFYCPTEHEGRIEYTIKDDGGERVLIEWTDRHGEYSNMSISRSDVGREFASGFYVKIDNKESDDKRLVVTHFKHRDDDKIAYTIVSTDESFDTNVITWVITQAGGSIADSSYTYSGDCIRRYFSNGTWVKV